MSKVIINRNNSAVLAKYQQKLDGGSSASEMGEPSTSNYKAEKQNLPVYNLKQRLVVELKKHQTCVILGETGSGKTTQIPQIIYENGLHVSGQAGGIIGITQPRRVAAVTLAGRVAAELGVQLGLRVGYSVRFEQCCDKATTLILFQTDGMLLREALSDPILSRYSYVILDEIHERTVHTDVLLAIVKSASMKRRMSPRPLKVILMSATINVDPFLKYFGIPPTAAFVIEGRQHDIELLYAKSPVSDVAHSAVVSIFQIHRLAQPGDILVFLTGADEIEQVTAQCRQTLKSLPHDVEKPRILALYATMSQQAQLNVFQKADVRKVIIATNIAETSITIPGVRYVVDGGKVKVRRFDPQRSLELLKVEWVSKAQANQRAGRAGREAAGVCYRLYTEQQYDAFADAAVPELLRCSLASVILELLKMNINNLYSFDFMDKPSNDSITAALTELQWLRAVTGDAESGETRATLKLSPLGEAMVVFPLDPKLSRLLLAARQLNCLDDMLSIVALISGESILLHVSSSQRDAAAIAHQKFFAAEGDLFMLLNVFRQYRKFTNEKASRTFCNENYVNMRNVEQVANIRKQLKEICDRLKLESQVGGVSNFTNLRKCLCYGYFLNVAQLQPDTKHYLTVESRLPAAIHPASCLFQHKPPVILYTEVVQTTHTYLSNVTAVDAEWLKEAAPDYFSKAGGRALM